MFSPATETIAFLIWAYATPRRWKCSTDEVADAIKRDRGQVSAVIAEKKWKHRLKSSVDDLLPELSFEDA